MDKHVHLIESFYRAFQKRDYAGMSACYHPEIHFKDEVFDLNGREASAMWHMLCERGKDLEIRFDRVHAQGAEGGAHWEAEYTFSASGRKVHNRINASFKFKDELIIQHIDTFDFWRWTRMALGTPGLLLGWSSMLRKKVAASAGKSLTEFIKTHPEYLPGRSS